MLDAEINTPDSIAIEFLYLLTGELEFSGCQKCLQVGTKWRSEINPCINEAKIVKNVLVKCKTLNFGIMYYSKITKKPCQIVSGDGRGGGGWALPSLL